MTSATVTDVSAELVADPFLLFADGAWQMFFEAKNAATGRGEIALAQSTDGIEWSYEGIVLAEPFHLSYPLVFTWDGETFMTPETLEAGAILLYRALEFPRRWRQERRLIEGFYADPTPFRYRDRWWMFACPTPKRHDRLALFSAPDLLGPWNEHPRSPIVVDDSRRARPAGAARLIDGKLVRFAQDCQPAYGSAVRAFEVTTLTLHDYAEREMEPSPLLRASGQGWNRDGMHHIDLHDRPGKGLIASVDGFTTASLTCQRVDSWETIAVEWEALLQRSRGHLTFASPTWFQAACAADAAREPFVIVARQGQSIAGVLPLVRTPNRSLEFSSFLTDYNDLVVASGDAETARALVQFVIGLGLPLSFRRLRPDSDLLRALSPYARQEIEAVCYAATLPNTFEEYLATRSHSFRKSLRRAERLAERERVQVRSLSSEEMDGLRLAEVFLELNLQRWGERSRFAGPGGAKFIRTVLPAALEKNLLRPFAIFAREKIVAIDLALTDHHALCTWNGGFDPAIASLSPGHLLFAAQIRWAIANGLKRFDMLRGRHRYKASWATESITLCRAEL